MILDNRNAVLADTVYCDNKKVAQDVAINLPAVNFLTTEVNAMGTMDVVLVGLIEAMEASITKIGIDEGLGDLLTPEKHNFEFRWAQNVLKSDGTTKAEGCKAFLTGVSKGVPAVAVEPTANIENEVTLAITRYQLYADGEEILCVDRLSQICRIRGKDYWSTIASML